MEIAGHDAKWFSQSQLLEKIRASMNTLDLKIITPMMYQKPVRMNNNNNVMQSRNSFEVVNSWKLDAAEKNGPKIVFNKKRGLTFNLTPLTLKNFKSEFNLEFFFSSFFI